MNHFICTNVCTSTSARTRVCTNARTSARTTARTSTHTSLSLTGASALLAWSILGMGDLGSSLGSGRRMRSLERLKEGEEKEEEEEVKCKNKEEIGYVNT